MFLEVQVKKVQQKLYNEVYDKMVQLYKSVFAEANRNFVVKKFKVYFIPSGMYKKKVEMQ